MDVLDELLTLIDIYRRLYMANYDHTVVNTVKDNIIERWRRYMDGKIEEGHNEIYLRTNATSEI